MFAWGGRGSKVGAFRADVPQSAPTGMTGGGTKPGAFRADVGIRPYGRDRWGDETWGVSGRCASIGPYGHDRKEPESRAAKARNDKRQLLHELSAGTAGRGSG